MTEPRTLIDLHATGELIACESCGGPAVGYWPTPFGRAWRCETDRNHDQESGFDRSRFVEVA